MPRLSAIIIALNEAGNIAGCLDALAFCDERIVVDGGSTDETAQIAAGKGARVVSHPFEGFGAQKGFALSLATGDWVLSIDADERVSPALAQEIKRCDRERQRRRLRAAAALGVLRPADGSFRLVARLRAAAVPARQGVFLQRSRARARGLQRHDRAAARAADARSGAPAGGRAVAHGPLLERRRRAACRRGQARVVHVRDFPRAVDVHSHLSACRPASSTAAKVFCWRSPMPRAPTTAT